MRNERPEFDEGGRKRIKRRKLGLKDTGVQLVDYRDSWTAIEDVIVLVMDSGTYKYYDKEKPVVKNFLAKTCLKKQHHRMEERRS
jgi:hypothetical protein